MRKPRKYHRSQPRTSARKAIRRFADYQIPWSSAIPALRRYTFKGVGDLSIPGDAPKDFVLDREYRPGHRTKRERTGAYIAKLGSKFYPNESITEHLVTRIGQIYGLEIADSKL